MPVVIALRSIFARSMMSPHFGHMCALSQRFSRLIEGSQIQQVIHFVQLLTNDHVLIRNSLKLPKSSSLPASSGTYNPSVNNWIFARFTVAPARLLGGGDCSSLLLF
jgi:hypothetical protein